VHTVRAELLEVALQLLREVKETPGLVQNQNWNAQLIEAQDAAKRLDSADVDKGTVAELRKRIHALARPHLVKP
jgi:hypothetical protein